MSLFDRVTHWFAPNPAQPEHRPPPPEAGPILDALHGVYDPEVNIDIVSMGLVRGIARDGNDVVVRMTLSTRGCPMGPAIVADVVAALESIGLNAEVELEFDPPWTVDDLTAEGRAKLGR